MELGLVFGGVAISALVEVLKRKLNTNALGTTLLVVVLSAVGGAAFYYLRETNLIDSASQILASAGAFYAFILKNVKSAADTRED